MTNQNDAAGLTALTADIVSAYVSHNRLDASDIESLITSTFAALQTAMEGPAAVEEKLTPPVAIKKSITPEALVSMEDGKRYKSLTRHLSTRGMTPAEYRTKWGLPSDYPMVAPDYAKRRSELAKASGLGRKAVQAEEVKVAPKRAPKAPTSTASAKAQVATGPKSEDQTGLASRG